MTSSIKNCRYAFLIRLDLMFSVIMKGVPIITNLNEISIRHLIKLILYENDVKILKFNRSPV